MSDQLLSRIFSRVEKQENGCWNWKGAIRGNSGYGAITVSGTTNSVHRVVYELVFGTIADGMYVCHKCDNKLCVNPDHLFLGTPKDNVVDAVNKKRIIPPIGGGFKIGSKAYNASISPDAVLGIKRLLKTGEKQQVIANLFGTKRHVVADIARGRSYFNIK